MRSVGSFSSIFVVLIAMLMTSCLFVRKDALYQPRVQYKPNNLDSVVGWYQYDSTTCALLTYSANGGLVLLSVEDRLIKQYLTPSENEQWTWVRGEGRRIVKFDKNNQKQIVWNSTQDNSTGTLTACEGNYQVKEVSYLNDSIRIFANLYIPTGGEGPYPGVVFIHGSGTSDRDNLWNIMFADYLVKRGFAILLPDKRGSGKSEGEWRLSSMDDLAKDTEAGLQFLSTLDIIDSARLGIIGFSQGGKVAPLVYQHYPDLSFIVNISGGTVSFNKGLRYESKYNLKEMGIPGFLAGPLSPVAASVAKRKRPVWWKKNGEFNPMPYWEQIKEVPVLILYGEDDTNMPINQSSSQLNNMIQRSNKSNFTVQVFSGTGHGLFQEDKSMIREDVLDTLSKWLEQEL